MNYAATGGNLDIIRLMVENGANVDQIDLHHNTPLMVAEEEGHDDVVALLKELGATK